MGVLIGYCVKDFRIRKARLPDACKALRGLKPGMWVDQSIDFNTAPLEEFLLAWRWQPLFSPEGDLVGLEFLGEKAGSDDDLLEALAPHVEPGATVLVSHDYGEYYLKFSDGALLHGDGGPIHYAVKGLRLAKSRQDAAAGAIRGIPPDYWFDCGDVAAMSFDDLLRAWRWKPTYDQDGSLVDLSYLGEGTGNERNVIEAIGPFADKGAIVECSTSFHDMRCAFDGTAAKWETVRYKGP